MSKPKVIRPAKNIRIPYIAPDLRHNAARINQFVLDPRNPRVGQVELVAESLNDHGQQKTITIYLFPGDSKYRVITGNHTTKAALSLGWKYIAVSEYLGTPTKAQAFALIDNRSSDLASYDEDVLAEVLVQMKDAGELEGTGYDDNDLTYLMSKLEAEGKDEDDPAVVKSTDADDLEDRELEHIELEEAFSVTVEKLQDDNKIAFKGTNKWGVPNLLPDMLADPPNDKMKTWPGKKYADEEWDGYWWLVWGWSSTGCPYDRAYLSFYTDDKGFARVFDHPGKYTQNMRGNNIVAAVTPDFSMWDTDPKIVKWYNNFKDRWMGRYFQEAGIKVVPNVCNSQLREDQMFIYSTVPKKPPCVAFQVQTGISKANREYSLNYYRTAIKYMLKILDPQSIIIYASRSGQEMTWSLFPKQLHVIRVATVQDVRRHRYNPDPLSGKVKSYKKKRRERTRQKTKVVV